MSGGSYDRLFLWPVTNNLPARRRMLLSMAERLEGLPNAAEAAAQTRRVLRLLDAAETVASSLEDVWHDVEWHDSGDYGYEQMAAAIEAYQAPDVNAAEGDARPPDPTVLYRMVDVGAGMYELRAADRDRP